MVTRTVRLTGVFVALLRRGPPVAGVRSVSLGHAATAQGAQRSRAGAIRGRVELRHVLAAVERRPNVSDLGSAAERDASDRLRSVVYLESAPRSAFDQTEPARAVM